MCPHNLSACEHPDYDLGGALFMETQIPNPVDDPADLDASDLVGLLGLSNTDALYARRYRGTCPPAVKVGKSLRWRRSTVQRWLEEHAERP